MIPMEQCKHGHLYHLNGRCFGLGIFIALPNRPGFIGIGKAFGGRYLDYEVHYEASERFGTAKPTEELGLCPIDVPLEMYPSDPYYTRLLLWLNDQENLLGGVR